MREYLNGIRTIFERELSAYFDAPIAYVVAGVFLVLAGLIFMNRFFLDAVIDMTPFFATLPYLLIPFIPAITMRGWAEERAQHTFELLMTLPLSSMQVVLGKFIAALAFYAVILLGTLPIVVMLLILGPPDPGPIVSGYVGAFCLGGLFLAFGLFASSLTRDQIVAFVIATLLGFLFVLSGHPTVVEVLDGLSPTLGLGSALESSISVLPRYEAYVRGFFGLADTLYFALMTLFFVWLNDVVLRRSRY